MKLAEAIAGKVQAVQDAVSRVIKGKQEVIELAVVALVAEGHLLIEDVPGVGKTTLGHALAKAVDCTFHRIQFTSDLLPTDVLGVSIYDPRVGEFQFKAGPIFANIILADEINRTTPKTQSALLEAMNESQVTIENVTYPLPRPFMVLATQNPNDHHGTYPLPESQLDRFIMKIRMGYPDATAEKEILKRPAAATRNETSPVLAPAEVLALQAESRGVIVDDKLVEYIVELAARTRSHPEIALGVSPRGTTALYRAAQAFALLHSRTFVVPDDIKRLAEPVFAHRLGLHRSGRNRTDGSSILKEILNQVPVPA